MDYVKCPICDLNYIIDGEKMCPVCAGKFSPAKKIIKGAPAGAPIILKEPVRHNGKAIFFVFQNQDFQIEFNHGYICAPYYATDRSVPHHWLRLVQVRKGDIILHGVVGHILAVSEAKGGCYDFTDAYGSEGRKIDCEYHLLNKPLRTADYKKEIIHYCSGLEYQPFNKNGDGNQGYLFDIRSELAIIFIKEIVRVNPALKTKPFLQDFI